MRVCGLLLLLLIAAGCASDRQGGEVRVRRLNDGRTLAQRFDQAYITRSEHGDYDVVLVADTTTDQAAPRRGNTLQPAANVPVRHMVHLRIFWRPLRGMRASDTATSNAAIDWFVLTPGAREGEDVLRYRGSGLVGIYPGERGASITMRNVRLEPELVHGQMTDPIGRAEVTGALQAVWDRQLVESRLAEMRALTSATAEAR